MSIYLPFNTFILRSPTFSKEILEELNFEDKLFQDAVNVASPEFYKILKNNQNLSNPKLRSTLYKYYSRMCTRATPFGLFSGCSVGYIGNHTKLQITPPRYLHSTARLDGSILYEIINFLHSQQDVLNLIMFYPNDSLYKVKDRYRYIEISHGDTGYHHTIQSVEGSDVLQFILDITSKGSRLPELINQVTNTFDVDNVEVISYVNKLIESQIIVSELSICECDYDTLQLLVSILREKALNNSALTSLITIQTILDELNQGKIIYAEAYSKIENTLNTMGIDYGKNNILQIDTYRPMVHNTISSKYVDDIQNAVDIFTKIRSAYPYESKSLSQFITSFVDRYECEEIPLLEVLDTDIGIGYPVYQQYKVDDQFLLNILPMDNQGQTINLSGFELFVFKKLITDDLFESKMCEEVSLDLNEFNHIPAEINTSSKTIAIMCNIYDNPDGKHDIYIRPTSYATAASIIGRFTHLNHEIENLAKSIYQAEEDPRYITAEIIHNSEPRVTNITYRKSTRKYKVHYLSNSFMHIKSLPASDLLVGYSKGELYVKSKTHNKRVRFLLSNAHNYTNSSIPLYKFLCDYQYYNYHSLFPLRVHEILKYVNYIPRIKYKNYLLSGHLQTSVA